MTTALVTPSRLASVSEGLPRTYWYLWAGMLVNRLGSFVMPLLMVYLTTEKGLSLVAAGAVVSAYGAGCLGGTTLGGVLSDRIGRRTTLLISLMTSAVSMLAVAIAPTPELLSVSVAVMGLTSAMYQPSTQAMIADLVEPRYRVKAFSYWYWAANLGFSLAALVGGFVAAKNFSLLFMLDAATMLVFAAVVWRLPETRQTTHAQASSGSALTPFVDGQFAPFLVLSFLGAFVIMQHLSLLPADMTLKSFGPSDYGMVIAVNGLIIVLLQPTVARLVMRGSRRKWLALASLFLGIGFGLTALATSVGFYAMTVVVWTLGEVIFAPLNASIVSDYSPPHMRGRYQGAYSLTWSLSLMAAPTVSPWVVKLTSMTTFWYLCALLGAATAIGNLVFIDRGQREAGAVE